MLKFHFFLNSSKDVKPFLGLLFCLPAIICYLFYFSLFPVKSSSAGQETFDKSHMINLILMTKVGELEGRLPHQDEEYGDYHLTKDDLLDFRSILLTYLDFKQKEKFNKLRKLRETQSNLPVYNHR